MIMSYNLICKRIRSMEGRSVFGFWLLPFLWLRVMMRTGRDEFYCFAIRTWYSKKADYFRLWKSLSIAFFHEADNEWSQRTSWIAALTAS